VNGEVEVVKKKNDAIEAITCKKRISTQRGLCIQSIKIKDSQDK
jgi:hypothetical protein